MEMHQELKPEESGNFEEMIEAANVSETGKVDPNLVPERKFSSEVSIFALPEDNNDKSKISTLQSIDSKTESPGKKTRGKTKLLGGEFLVNIHELAKDVAGSFDEEGSILSRVSSNCPGYSFPHAESALSSKNISDLTKPQTSNCRENAASVSPSDAKEDPDSLRLKKMQIEPTLPIYLKFKDVKYKVAVKGLRDSKADKYVLHGITGSVQPGEVLALMGPSGGGKTTLLSLLSGMIKLNSGTITYNDQLYTKSLKKRIGYVMQDDVLFPHLTVRETLTYAALLRLPNTLTRLQKKERATNVIIELGLERCQDTIIGGKFVRGVSGGERKRVCIGNEVLLNPSLLFLDEPTSGLDSTGALKIVQMLQNIAEDGKTVVTTIHQPSSRVFSKFDKLILLGKGSSLYSGKASEVMGYFSSIGCSPLIAMNPAEFLIDLANGNMNDKSFPSELETNFLPGSERIDNGKPSPVAVHEYLVEAYGARARKLKKRKLLKPVTVEGELEMQGSLYSRVSPTTWWEQFSILLRRGLKERRHNYISCLRLAQVISIAIIIGLLWCRSDASSPNRLEEQAGLLFFISVFWGFLPLFTAIFTYPQERAMLAKERSVDMYKLSAYFLARNISDLPLDLMLPVVFLVIVYLMVGLRPGFIAFSLTTLTVFLSIVAAQGLGHVIGAAFMDLKKATTLASVVVMTFMLSGGFFIKNVPYFMSWVRYISFTYHSYRLLLKIQYSCSDSDPGSDSCDSPFIKEQRLDQGGLEVGAMMAMIVGYRLLAYIFLRRKKIKIMA